MERYSLSHFYGGGETPVGDFLEDLKTYVSPALAMGLTATAYNETLTFIAHAIYGYFYNDLIVYPMEVSEDFSIFLTRIGYDISVKLPYWNKKYAYIKKLLTTEDLSLLQTSKMTSSSNDTTKSAGGTLQKTATTPTGVSTDSSTDEIDITIGSGEHAGEYEIDTTGFVDKYTNAQQKFANATNVEGTRSGEILREGSIDDLLKVLEKLPSSFADEITKDLQKHFIFDYDGEEKGIYNED
ncbi:MAG: hypothetical protein J6T10_07770 [Methanobrevibacter sp.]|nr:hypothetical protein [Methanobrevibacter sp.]